MASPLSDAPNFKHPRADNLTLFVAKQPKGTANYWYCRATFSRTKQALRSLKLKYVENDAANQAEAEKIALQKYYELDKLNEQGKSLTRKSLLKVGTNYINQIRTQTLENIEIAKEGASPIHTTGGRSNSFWDWDKYQWEDNVWQMVIKPWWERRELAAKDISTILTNDIERWSVWRTGKRSKELKKEWSASTLNKQNRVLRNIFKYAEREGYLQNLPLIKDFEPQLRKNRRPEIKQGQFTRLINYIDAKAADETIHIYTRAYNRLFSLYLKTLDATGIRPFNSSKNALMWKHIQIKKNKAGDVEFINIERNEKNKTYYAVADPQWIGIYEDLKIYQDIWAPSEYVFAHPFTIEARKIIAGNPIGTFDRQWRNAMNHFETLEPNVWAPKGARQKDRISKYSIRHRYAARRLIHNKDIQIHELAQVMGSSVKQIEETYWHFQAQDNYKELVSTGYQINAHRVRLRDPLGLITKHTDRNSDEHKEHYALYPHLTEKPDA